MTPAGKTLRRLVVTNKVEDSVHLSLLVDEVEAEAVAAERARIRAAVEALPGSKRANNDGTWREEVDRATVLAAIDGSEK